MAGIYDVTLTASTSSAQLIPAMGGYVKVKSAPAGAVKIRLDSGESFLVEEGQGLLLPDGVTFRDVTGTNGVAIAQTVLLFIGDSRFEDTRITGVVSVIDGGRSRSLAGQSWLAYASKLSAAAQVPVIQLLNPTANRRGVAKSILVSLSAAGVVSMRRYVTALTTGPFDVNPKLLGPAGATNIKLYTDTLAAGPGAVTSTAFYVPANTAFLWPMQDPIVIPPGEGFVFFSDQVLSSMQITIEGYDEPNT